MNNWSLFITSKKLIFASISCIIVSTLSEHKSVYYLPEEFQKYFWDVAFNELSFEKYPGFIAERLLNFGDLNAIKWLLSHTNNNFIRSLIENNRNLNAKTKNFWQIMLT